MEPHATTLVTAAMPAGRASAVVARLADELPLWAGAVLLSPDLGHVFLDKPDDVAWELPTCRSGPSPVRSAMVALEDASTLVRAPIRVQPDVVITNSTSALVLWAFTSDRDDVCGAGAAGGFFPVDGLPRGLVGLHRHGVGTVRSLAVSAVVPEA